MGLGEMSFQIFQVLSSLQNNFQTAPQHNSLRNVFTTGGNFEISIKRFSTYWREYPGGMRELGKRHETKGGRSF
jgi:hypothetical protein